VAFSDEEIAYLQAQPIARLATVNADGQPDVVPVAFELDGPYIWVGGVGPDVANTRKLRNIGAGRTKVSLVVDDLVSMEPFIARALAGVRRRGTGGRAGGHGRARALQPHQSTSVLELESGR
jgi:pyridoxamine 5'-phosphate oxidase family protein